MNDQELVDYLEKVVTAVGDGRRDISIAYSPLNGELGDVMVTAMVYAGFEPPQVIPGHFEFDPNSFFYGSTLDDPQTFRVATAIATDSECDLILAHSSDGTEVYAAAPSPDGSWTVLSRIDIDQMIAQRHPHAAHAKDPIIMALLLAECVAASTSAEEPYLG